MSAKLEGTGTPGQTVYGVRKNDAGQVWNTLTSAFEDCTSGNAAHYATAAPEMGGASTTGVYQFVDPSPTIPGKFYLTTQAGGSFALSDIANYFYDDACYVADIGNTVVTLPTTPPAGYGPGSAGSGEWTVSINVNDGTNPLEGASVVLVMGATYNGPVSTDASGVASGFLLDTGTWQVRITCPGYTPVLASLNVTADTTLPTYSMTAITIIPPGTGNVTAVLYVYKSDGVTIFPNADLYYAVGSPLSDVGRAFDSTNATHVISGLDGKAQLLMTEGVSYWYKVGENGSPLFVTIPNGSTSPYNLGSIVGFD